MKTEDDYKKFLKELKTLCENHHIGIIGTCEQEGIYGEISLFDMDDPGICNWADPEEKANYELDCYDDNGLCFN